MYAFLASASVEENCRAANIVCIHIRPMYDVRWCLQLLMWLSLLYIGDKLDKSQQIQY